ncbi:3749_t:CDS:2, partial [Cetraspora pellucida]
MVVLLSSQIIDELINGNDVQDRKKKQRAVASSSSQVIDELLNDSDDLQDVDDFQNDYETASLDGLQSSPTLELSIVPPRCLSPILDSRTNTNIQNDFYHSLISSTVAPLRKSSTLETNSSNNMLGHFDLNNTVIPSPFSDMSIYQICLWLCSNLNILQLANCMNFSMQTLAADGSRFTPSILPAISTTISNPYDKTKASRDYLEELKCLFLRVRNPPRKVIENLVRQIIKCDLNSAEEIEWLQIATKHFGDFCNKLINSVEKLVEEFKEKRIRSITSPLQKEEIIVFVDESTTINMLNRWLSATNIDEL